MSVTMSSVSPEDDNHTRANPCESHQCQNGGICEEDKSSVREYKCNCEHGYSGDYCEATVHLCGSHDCENGGICNTDQSSVRGYTCTCISGYVGDNCEVLPFDCKVIRDYGNMESRVYVIFPYENISTPVTAYCDMQTLDGGWTAIQKRVIGFPSFDKTWAEYKNGFGAPEQDTWIGNDVIHLLTKKQHISLYVSITLLNGTMLYQLYDRFFISNEAEKYRLFLGRNTAGTLDNRMTNSLMPHGVYERLDLNGTSFSTPDRDNDWAPHGHCAALQRGGWWFHRCYSAFLNGLWASKKWIKPWFPAVHYGTHLRGTWMMVKRIERDD